MKQQQGSALILVLGFVAIISSIALTLLWPQQLWFNQQLAIVNRAKAHTLALAGIEWARILLLDDARTSKIDYLGEPWAIPLPPISIEEGEISGFLVDGQGLFNINNLMLQPSREQTDFFTHLLRLQNLPLTGWETVPPTPIRAKDQTIIWSPSRPLRQLEELTLFDYPDSKLRMPSQLLTTLSMSCSALPEYTPINVNTIPDKVLRALVANLSEEETAKLLLQRREKPFQDTADFLSRLPQPALKLPLEMLSVNSRYFFVVVAANQTNQHLGEANSNSAPITSQVQVTALLRREEDRLPTVIWQSIH